MAKNKNRGCSTDAFLHSMLGICDRHLSGWCPCFVFFKSNPKKQSMYGLKVIFHIHEFHPLSGFGV